MKKILLSLVIALFALPAFAKVNMTCEGTCGGGNSTPIATPPVVITPQPQKSRGSAMVIKSPFMLAKPFYANETLYFGVSHFSKCRLEYKDGKVIVDPVIGTGHSMKAKVGTANLICQAVPYSQIPKEYGVNFNTFFHNTDWEKDYNFGEVIIK